MSNMKPDPIRLEVFRNAFDMIADEMALILMKAAHSPIVRDSMDFSTALCDEFGQTVAQGVTTPMHLGSFYDAMQHLIRQFDGQVEEGDVFMANDPYAASGQHLPDIYVIKPIFHEGRIVGWATTVAHHADVGGIVPGSNAIGAREIYQEGLRLPFIKAYAAGKRNDTLFDIIALNVRVPDMVMGDINAQLAAAQAGVNGLLAMIGKYGQRMVADYMDALHDYAEKLARSEILDIPDGTYHFTDHIDGLGEHGEPIVFKAEVRIAGDEVFVDWTGSSAQVPGGINTPLPFTKAGVYAALRSVMKSQIPNCHGFTRAVHVTAPLGTVMNSVHPAPAGARGITGYRVIDCMFGALASVVPERVTADGAGGASIPAFGGWHEGRPFVFAETFMGPWGAGADHDGQEGVPHVGANQANVPVELIEANYPLRIWQYGILPDTGGAGKWRGGNALVREYELLANEATFTLRSDKEKFPPHGLAGGHDGAARVNRLITSKGVQTLPSLPTEAVELTKGDRFYHVTPSGGGFGDPMERSLDAIRDDLRAGKMTSAHAQAFYGVVMRDGEIDVAATQKQRIAARA
jgi:N-methylhydantoinase B